MAPASINGWPVLFAGDKRLRTGTVPGTTKSVTLRDEFLPLALSLLVDLNAKVVPLSTGPLDGWEVRTSRTSSNWSNHASGTAFDIHYSSTDPRWPAWPSEPHQQWCTPAQVNAVHTILDKYVTHDGHRVLGWGGDWSVDRPGKPGYCDPMHFEIGQGWEPRVGRAITVADVREVTTRLAIRVDGSSGDGLHVVRVNGRTPLSRAEVIRQSTMSTARFERFNPKCPDVVPPGTAVRVPLACTAIAAGLNRT